MAMLNEATIQKLKNNPHYKPSPGQLIPDGYEEPKKEEEKIKTFGVPPIQHTVIPKHPTSPTKRVHKKQIAQ